MNPHDPSVRPGAHLVAAELGVEDPWELSDRHPLRSPLDIVGRLVATAAHETDDLHADLTHAAQAAIEKLEPIAQGKATQIRGSYALLGSAGPQLELLAARRDTAYQQLARAVAGYRLLLPEAAGTAAQGLGPELERTAEDAPGGSDDWAIAGDRQIQALRAVDRGGLRLKQSALSEQDRYLSDGTGVLVPIWAQTVERMLADGLLDLDTTTTPTQGQLLSLTARGQAALQRVDDVAAAPGPATHDVAIPTATADSSSHAVDPLPSHEELLALEEIKHGRVLLKELAFRSGLRVETGSGARIAIATVEAMQERGWIERDESTSLNFGQQLSLTGSGETAFRAASAQDPRTTAALSRSTPNVLPSPPAQPPAAGPAGHTNPTRSR
ncbi:hypothetical protein [Actinacidiphila guanduensis]|uniref:Large ATP-binding protein n=1 Tax=Actinacidiphila guanduensis TaxID=310781 RepID=A0A1H0SGX4_9ACTN|nr:hypothetical protein [Actinacidiphila guanduensis]SDP40994.1 hypothetical protein SAMN05216259_12821 [Actinacidiphila guanduensis]